MYIFCINNMQKNMAQPYPTLHIYTYKKLNKLDFTFV